MPAELTEWAPRVALRLRKLPARMEGRLRALVAKTAADAAKNAPRDTGKLARSVYGKLTKRAIEIGATATYARIIEEGGIIRPIHSRYLAVPLQKGLPAAGPRADGKLFVFRSKDGRLFLASRAGGNLDVRWRLMDQVVRRARPFLQPAVDRLVKRLPDELGQEITDTLLGKGGR